MRDFYGLLMLCSLPLISRGFTGSLPSKPAFRSTLQRLSMAADESPQEEPVDYLKYQDYIEKNEELFQKIKTHYDVPENDIESLLWDWEVANDQLGEMEQRHLLKNDDPRLLKCQQKATEYRLGLLLALATFEDSADLQEMNDPAVIDLMKKRIEGAWKLELSERDTLIDLGIGLRVQAEMDPNTPFLQLAKDHLQARMKKHEGLEEEFADLFAIPGLEDTNPETKQLRKDLEGIYKLEMSDKDEQNYVEKCRHVKKVIQEQEEKLKTIWEAGLSTKDQVAYFAKLVRVEQRMNPESSELPELKAQLQEMLRPYGDLQAAFSDLLTSEFE